MIRRTAVVYNPASRSGSSGEVHAAVLELAKHDSVDQVLPTSCPKDATKIARSLCSEGFQAVVAVGGDGTINEVMNGLVGTDTALGVVPAGTGNDWIRSVGIPLGTEEAWQVALNGKVVKSDVGEAVGHRYFLNVAGVGFDAEVARTIQSASGVLEKFGPKPRYVLSVLKTFFGYHGSNAILEVDGKSQDIDKLFLMAVAVAQYYGSGMKIAPDASIDDGYFDLVWGRDVRMYELPGLLNKIFSGSHISHKKVESARCKELTLTSSEPLPFHLDGDVAGTTPVTFKIHEKALNIIVP